MRTKKIEMTTKKRSEKEKRKKEKRNKMRRKKRLFCRLWNLYNQQFKHLYLEILQFQAKNKTDLLTSESDNKRTRQSEGEVT